LSSIMIFHVLGTISLTEYIGVPLKPRYWAPAAVLLIILAVAIGDELLNRWARPRIQPMVRIIAFACVLAVVASSVLTAAPRAGRIYWSPLVQEFLAAYSMTRASKPKMPIFAGPEITARVLPYPLEHDVHPASQLEGAIKGDLPAFLLFMDESEADPIEAGLLPNEGFEVRKLTADQHGVLMWVDRAAALKAAFGWPDPTAIVPPRSLVIYKVTPTTPAPH